MISPDGLAHMVKKLNNLGPREAVHLAHKDGTFTTIMAVEDINGKVRQYISNVNLFTYLHGSRWRIDGASLQRKGRNHVTHAWIDTETITAWEFSPLEE